MFPPFFFVPISCSWTPWLRPLIYLWEFLALDPSLGFAGGRCRPSGGQVPARRAPPVNLRPKSWGVEQTLHLVRPQPHPLPQHDMDDPGPQDLVCTCPLESLQPHLLYTNKKCAAYQDRNTLSVLGPASWVPDFVYSGFSMPGHRQKLGRSYQFTF